MMGPMFRVITISGMLGSGKSTVARLLADKLGYTYYSTGDAQREIARARGVTTLELNRIADTDPTIDEAIDGVFKRFNAVPNKNFVIDSRMAFFFIPNSLKVKLNVDVAVDVLVTVNVIFFFQASASFPFLWGHYIPCVSKKKHKKS